MTTVFDEQLTPHEAADLAAEYKQLSEAIAVTEKRHATIKAQLKRYVAERGELHVEGLETLVLQPRSGQPTWDVLALHKNDPVTFARLLELGCLTINTSVAKAQEAAGAVTGFRQYSHPTAQEPALIWIKK